MDPVAKHSSCFPCINSKSTNEHSQVHVVHKKYKCLVTSALHVASVLNGKTLCYKFCPLKLVKVHYRQV